VRATVLKHGKYSWIEAEARRLWQEQTDEWKHLAVTSVID